MLFVTTGGFYSVSSITDATTVVLTNLGYAGNASSGTVVASSKTVSAGGLIGLTGATGAAGGAGGAGGGGGGGGAGAAGGGGGPRAGGAGRRGARGAGGAAPPRAAAHRPPRRHQRHT